MDEIECGSRYTFLKVSIIISVIYFVCSPKKKFTDNYMSEREGKIYRALKSIGINAFVVGASEGEGARNKQQ